MTIFPAGVNSHQDSEQESRMIYMQAAAVISLARVAALRNATSPIDGETRCRATICLQDRVTFHTRLEYQIHCMLLVLDTIMHGNNLIALFTLLIARESSHNVEG